jgi:hypothetical protein
VIDLLSALLIVVLLCSSAGLGMFISPRLPAAHRARETIEMMRNCRKTQQSLRRHASHEGCAQDLYGQAADTARDNETQPYTTTIVALGIGWLLGRMHRPL